MFSIKLSEFFPDFFGGIESNHILNLRGIENVANVSENIPEFFDILNKFAKFLFAPKFKI